jgi:hypothetical protein
MAREELPTVFGIIFDRAMLGEFPEDERRAGSLVPGPTAARNVAYELIDKYLGRQVVWVGCYEKDLQVVLDFTSDGFQAHQAIQQLRGQRNPQESFLYAALFSAVHRMSQRSEKRRVLVVFLESLDSDTLDRIKPLKNLLSASNVELFFIRFGSRLSTRAGGLSPQMSEGALRELAGATAGETFVAADYGEHMEDLTRRMYNYIRTLYTFGFQAESSREKPGRLSITCARTGSRVRARPVVPALP